MVLAFGPGVDDVITAGKLAKTVISELEKISKLDTGERQLNQLDRIKAISKSCQDPLQKFLDRLSKFDQSLGAQSVRGKSAKDLGRRTQWKLACINDVTKLRAVLRGHVGLLTLLINLQTLFCY
ncbi:hypothetical protein N7G274_000649 [Stereocaulon virgatum]|uniref:Uncharacterized protein n=1 Tax=Stereocaulon virgatum TaxID=373712 RepID=A0ABR4APD1_9LECA